MAAQQLIADMRRAGAELEAVMQKAVAAELRRTVQRWREDGKPPKKWLRARDGDPEDVRTLQAWSLLGNDLLWSGRPSEAALAERLYLLPVQMAEKAEADHSGLDLHKGIEYFALGMALFHQGVFDEGAHYILRAVEEDTQAGSDAEGTVAAKKLNEELLREIPRFLEDAADLCRTAGHSQFTAQHISQAARDMLYDPATGRYRPVWALWLYSSIRKTKGLRGRSEIAAVQRLEALQDSTFLYEAALKERLGLAGGTLKAVVREVQSRKGHTPHAVLDCWEEYTRFGGTAAHPSPDDALAALQAVAFAGLTQAEVLCCHALLTLGLVRNMTHHQMDLSSRILGAEYEWVLNHVLAALLLSW